MTERFPDVAYLSQGKLHLYRDGKARPVTSLFGEDVRRREEEIFRRHQWKAEGSGARFLAGGLLFAAQELAPSAPARVESIAPGREPSELLYSLRVAGLGGLFRYDLSEGRESRLHHGRETVLGQLSRPGPGGAIACSLKSTDGSSHLALLSGDGYDVEDVTEGDSLDEAPSWVEGEGRRALVYQTAGIGRTHEGHFAGRSAYAIHRLDLQTGEIEELASDESHDLLGPRELEDGTLLFIRCPRRRRGPSFFHIVLNVLLLPFKLLYAIFQWLNFFTMRYTGKPLTTDGGEREGADARQMMVWGNLIDAARAEQEGRKRGEGAPSLVGSDWKLIERGADGREGVLATGVLSFDRARDGAIVYTNGTEIVRLAPDGTREKVCEGRFIEQVIALP